MREKQGRLLLVLAVAVCLLGLAGTAAFAGLGLGSTPNNATQNSIWNITATWSDPDGIAPILDKSTMSEDIMDWGWPEDAADITQTGPTIGFSRWANPPTWDKSQFWLPAIPPPDGFIGFSRPIQPNDPFNDYSDILPATGENLDYYEPNGYAGIQPDSVNVPLESGNNPLYDRGVDYVVETISVKQDFLIPKNPADPTKGGLLPWPSAAPNYAVNPMWVRAIPQVELDSDPTSTAYNADKTLYPRPATPAVIVTSREPLGIVAVGDQKGNPIRAQIVNAASLYPINPVNNAGWPSYNVIQLMADDATIAGLTTLVVAYYAPGMKYVVTQQAPLPMPYTAYKIPVRKGSDGVPYLPINPGILNFDPDRNGDLNDPNLNGTNTSPLLGVFADPELWDGLDQTNYFDLTTEVVDPLAPPTRYEAPNAPGSQHPTFGKLFFLTPPPPNPTPNLDQFFYVVVSTNAVQGVYNSKTPAPDHSNDIYHSADLGLTGTDALGNPVTNTHNPSQWGDCIGYCAKEGVIRLGSTTGLTMPAVQSVGLDQKNVEHFRVVTGPQTWVKYRKLSNTTVTVGRTNAVGLVDAIPNFANGDGTPFPYPNVVGNITRFPFSSVDAQAYLPNGKFTIDTKTLPTGTYALSCRYWPVFPMISLGGQLDTRGVIWYKNSIPMLCTGKGDFVNGMNYSVSVSAGLKMGNVEQQPDQDVTLNRRELNNKLIYDERGWPMYYDGALTGGDPNPPARVITAWGYGVKDRKVVTYAKTVNDNITVTVHGGLTDLWVYNDAPSMPATPEVDPLAVEQTTSDEVNPNFPDDGSSSTQFIFRCRYYKDASYGVLPPMPWLPAQADPWYTGASSGVVLYLDENGTGDYKPHFMQPDYESNGMGPNYYMYRIMPHCKLFWNGPGPMPLNSTNSLDYDSSGNWVDNSLYQSLQMGVYHYYFAASSDSLRFTDINVNLNSFAFENQNPSKMNPKDPNSKSGLEEWGQIARNPYYSTGLDPSAARAVTGYPKVDRRAGRRYSDDGTTIITSNATSSLYVQMCTRAPGLFENWYPYPYKCEVHPRVSCELHMPSYDDFMKPYDHLDYGEGRFFGTLFPFRTALNPMHPGVRGGGMPHVLAETSGSYSTDSNVFRIFYRQLDNKAPFEIKLWVNNANEKTGSDTAHQYASYTMYPRPDQTNLDYRKGVWYEYKLESNSAQLPYGPHTYYFTAYDGEHRVRWPVRPDHYQYVVPDPPSLPGMTGPFPHTYDPEDEWEPSSSFAYERGTAGYFDNDYVPGPYVNHAPQLLNVAVTPSAGKEGTHFTYSAMYTDADGQRPYDVSVTIQTSDSAQPRTFEMYPDTTDPNYPTDPTADNSAKYKAGVRYILDAATIKDLALDNGVRKFYMTCIDDWGRQDEPNDRRQGETSRYPAGDGNWIQGPVISGNTPPTLSNGQVSSMDSTANAATIWSFKVTYRDLDRDAPALMKVFIGRLQPTDITTPTPSNKVKTIIWDSGHTMLPSNPADTVYSHGVEYYYQTRLAGPDTVAPQMVTKLLNITAPTNQIDPDPGKTQDIIRIWKIFPASDPGTNYYSFTGTIPPDYTGALVTLNGTIPAGDVYIQYERRPVVQYYYAFEAYDGVDYATYKNSSDATQRSDAASCFVLQDAVIQHPSTDPAYAGATRPRTVRQLVVDPLSPTMDPDPSRMGDIVRIWGVYEKSDLTGTNYYPLADGQVTPANYDNTTHPLITLSGPRTNAVLYMVVEADGAHYKIRPLIAKQVDLDATVPVSPLNAAKTAFDPDAAKLNDIVRIWGVYRTEDLDKAAGMDLLDDASQKTPLSKNWYTLASNPPADYDNSTHPLIPLNGLVPSGKIWVVFEGDTPLVGPMPIASSAPAGVIPDPEVFQNFTQSGIPQPISDQKNGFIDEFPNPATGVKDRAVVFMAGQASKDSRPSSEYVAPNSASDIASVEGVYWLSNPDITQKYFNYYDPALITPPVVRTGIASGGSAVIAEPEEAAKVIGVYNNQSLTGVNYYAGDRTVQPGTQSALKWQPAWVVGPYDLPTRPGGVRPNSPSVIWPTKPNDIGCIQGIYLSMNVSDADGNFWGPDVVVDNKGKTTINNTYVVPADADPTGAITIDARYNMAGAIKAILKINASADLTGTDYYISTDPAGDPYDPTTPLHANQAAGDPPVVPPALTTTVYVSYVPNERFGPNHEFMALKKALPVIGEDKIKKIVGQPKASIVYIAYYPSGDMSAGYAPLADVTLNGPVYVKIWPKAFNPGDKYVKLTTPLPDLTTTAAVNNAGLVTPDPTMLSDIGTVTGVFVANDPFNFNYYTGTSNPFKVGDTQIHLAQPLTGSPLPAAVTVKYLPRQRDVTIKYADMRFTHQMTGYPAQMQLPTPTNPRPLQFDPDLNMFTSIYPVNGTMMFWPDGLSGTNMTGDSPLPACDPLKSFARDVDGGIIGMWLSSDQTGLNYFNPRRTSLYDDNALWVRLSTEVPQGTTRIYARGYQKGTYYIDRWNRNLRFDPSVALTDLDRIQVSYFFGTKMTQVLVPNTLPVLMDGKVSPLWGPRNAGYVYSVRYRDTDGPTGQTPTYVRVYIDGAAFDMTPVVQGTPNYADPQGAQFTFTPTGGLSGKPHTFYFEASDGAAIAWFDNNGGHNTDRAVAAGDIAEMDGPWVNDPPVLSNGYVSPNPTGQGAGIGTTESADYFVTLQDADNDPPYDWMPADGLVGKDVTGSPRVWIDAGLTDDAAVPVYYTIIGLLQDPSEMSKMRVLRAGIDNGDGTFRDPQWTTDQFAGQLLQITNGNTWPDVSPSPYKSVYLIQSNTANTLTLAIDDLTNAKLYPIAPDPTTQAPRYVKFRVNGLLMTKADPNQIDNWVTGVTYKVTVPRLQVGLHKFHFTARTREDKPDWLLKTPNFTDTAPYSDIVKFPAIGDSTGPNVIVKVDIRNHPPVLTKVPSSHPSTLYDGALAQATQVTQVTPSVLVRPYDYNRNQSLDYGSMLTILGAYRNANFDAQLDPNAASPIDRPKDFLDLATLGTNNPPAIGTGAKVPLTTLYPCPDTMVLVQRCNSIVNSTTIIPDAPQAIGTPLNVYLWSDPTLLNKYTITSFANNQITVNPPLPAGTMDVFITYNPKVASINLKADGNGVLTLPSPNTVAYIKDVYQQSDAGKTNLINPAAFTPGNQSIAYLATPTAGTDITMDYVPWPPVYLKYYARETAGTANLHAVFKAGEPLTFTVLYTDADNDKPTYHDGVQGYVKVLFNDIPGRTAQLQAMVPPVNYSSGVPYGVTLTDVPPGLHTYHFEASDGFVVTRFPDDPAGNAAKDEKVQINYKPLLYSGTVDHASAATNFTFSVMYKDVDGTTPPSGGVQLYLTNTVTGITYKPLQNGMTVDPTSSNYAVGARFNGFVDVVTSNLPIGSYKSLFTATDGTQNADQLAGPDITIRQPDANHHPVIADYWIYRQTPSGPDYTAAGKTSDTFVYQARYTDSYGDPPVATIGGVRQTALYLIVDGDTAHPYAMTMVPQSGAPDYTSSDINNPNWPIWETRITGKVLKGGNHTYTVKCNDGTVDGVFADKIPPIKYGPTLMIPYFALQVLGRDRTPINGQSIVGQEVLIEGQMFFPYIAGAAKPNDITNLVIQVTKPDATVISLTGTVSIQDYNTTKDTYPSNYVGIIAVQYSGYVDPALATGSSLTLVSGGQWIIDASWVGDSNFDGAKTDAVFDGRNDQVRVSVSGPSRTIATLNPLLPDTTAPVVDMITPPMMIGNSDPSKLFGPDRALTMQLVKWAPKEGIYYRYDVGGYFPPLKPGDAVWIKPKLGTGSLGYPAAEPITRAAVEDGWTTLDNPTTQTEIVNGTPRYLTSSYRLIKVYAQALPQQTDGAGNLILDNATPAGTALPLLKPCTMPLSAGWNQFGCIFVNWKKAMMAGTVRADGKIQPTNPADVPKIGRVLGVFTTQTPTANDKNYYQPGVATQPYAKGDAAIVLTRDLPLDTQSVWIKYEVYPKEDLGIPISELHVTHLGVKKSLADAKTAGWITDYAWRYDATVHNYVAVSDTKTERVLKAWSGYWIKAYVDCDLEIDPNTTFNGFAAAQAARTTLSASPAAATEDMIPPPPAPQ